MLDQDVDVTTSLPQWWQMYAKYVEAIQQVGPKQPFAYHLVQIPIRRSNNPDICRNGYAAS